VTTVFNGFNNVWVDGGKEADALLFVTTVFELLMKTALDDNVDI
jgi:hypothetical protein